VKIDRAAARRHQTLGTEVNLRLPWGDCREATVTLGTILLIILVLLVIGALPSWPYSSGWGYYPSGGLGVVLVIIIILVLLGRF
jgi:hypothetical protein